MKTLMSHEQLLVNRIADALQAKREFDGVSHLPIDSDKYIKAEIHFQSRAAAMAHTLRTLVEEENK